MKIFFVTADLEVYQIAYATNSSSNSYICGTWIAQKFADKASWCKFSNWKFQRYLTYTIFGTKVLDLELFKLRIEVLEMLIEFDGGILKDVSPINSLDSLFCKFCV